MKTSVERLENNRVVLEVELEAEQFAQAIGKAYHKLVKRYNVPGFRRGKAPRKILENFIGKASFYQEALEIMLPEAYSEAVKDTQIEPVDQPQLEVIKMDEGEPVVFKATVEVKPEVQLGQYQGLEITRRDYQVTADDVQDTLEQMQQQHAQLVVKEGLVEQGDTVIIDFNGTIAGADFKGGSAQDYTLKIGSGVMIGGFEEQLVGMQAGDQQSITVTFPDNYHSAELAGQEAVFEITLKDVKQQVLPAIDDQFAQDMSEFDTLEELKQDIENKLTTNAAARASQEMRQEAVTKATENASVELPEAMVERRLDSLVNNFSQNLAYQGIKMEQYFSATGQEMDELRKAFSLQAIQSVKTDLVLEAVAKQAGIEADEEDINQEIEKLALQYGQKNEAMRSILAAQDNLDSLKHSIKLEKAADVLLEQSVAVEPEEVPAVEDQPAE